MDITAKMAAQFNKGDSSPKRSSLEPDDGCAFYSEAASGPHLAKQNLFGGVGMDVCDSGVSMSSFGCEGVPNLGIPDPVKPKLSDLQTPTTFVSVGYASYSGPEDSLVDSGVDVRMESLSISCSEAVTTTSSVQTASSVAEPADPRRTFIDKLRLYYTPDDDGDT